MKTKTKFTLFFNISGYALLCFIPFYFKEVTLNSPIGQACIGLAMLFIIIALFNTTSYVLTDRMLIKQNFLGLLKTKYPLEDIMSLKKIYINHNALTNPLSIASLFVKDKNFFKFYEMTCSFRGDRHLKISSRTMSEREFEELKTILKASIEKNKR